MPPVLTVEAIDRFIGQGNPLAQAGGARTLLRATDGNLTGAAFLAALARKESEFGRTAGKFRNNFWGWGVHLSPSVHTSPSVEEGARKVWRGLNSGLYKGAGLVTPGQIIMRYAPPVENNTQLYQSQVGQWFTQLGLSPQTNIFGGPSVTIPSGPVGQAAAAAGVPATTSSINRGFTAPGQINATPAAPTPFVLTPQLKRQLAAYLVGSRRDVEAGIAPRDPLSLVRAIGVAQVAARRRADMALATPTAAPPRTMSLSYGALPTSAPGGGLKPGGGWGGSEAPAKWIAKVSGLPITSEKRTRQRTASGGVSDHWTGSANSYAVDLGTSGAAGDAAYAKIMAALGRPELKSGQWHNINIGGYRYQIGWRTPGHYDHIHVGVKKL